MTEQETKNNTKTSNSGSNSSTAVTGKKKIIKKKRSRRKHRKPSEYQERVIDIRRVTRVMAGGKRFRFRATVVVGNGKGKVGVGNGKGLDVVQAINKAKDTAKKQMIEVQLKDNRTILHEVTEKFSAAKVLIKPAKKGHGLKAGGATRVVLDLLGVEDATAKCLSRTGNKFTNARATIEALKAMKDPALKNN